MKKPVNVKCRAKNPATCKVHGTVYLKEQFIAKVAGPEPDWSDQLVLSGQVEHDLENIEDLSNQVSKAAKAISSGNDTPEALQFYTDLRDRHLRAMDLQAYRKAQREAHLSWERTDEGYAALMDEIDELNTNLNDPDVDYPVWERSILEEHLKILIKRSGRAYESRVVSSLKRNG